MKNYFLRPRDAAVLGALKSKEVVDRSQLAVESGLAPTEVGNTIAMLGARGLVEETSAGVALTPDGEVARQLAGPDRRLATFEHATPGNVFVVDNDVAELADSMSSDDLDAALDAEVGWSETGATDESPQGDARAQ